MSTSSDSDKLALPENYKVVFHTSNRKDAGTDALVYISLLGENGTSTNRHQCHKADRKCFEQGAVDEFSFTDVDVGKVTRIRVGHDGSGNKPGWHLEKVIVHNLDNNTQSVFPANCWFAIDEGDKKKDRLLSEKGPVKE